MVGEGIIYLRQDSIVLHCGCFLIHMRRQYLTKKFFGKVYQQKLLYYVEYWDSFIASFVFKNI